MSKYFRPWNIDQTLLLLPNVQEFVPKDRVSQFIVELVLCEAALAHTVRYA
jgi:hypothetical protein